jgi:hypothetical protein
MHIKSAVLFALLCGALGAQEGQRVELEGLLTAEPVPAGYQVSRQDVKNGDEVALHQVLIAKPEATSRVAVTVEPRKMPTRLHKSAALKAYINATASSLVKAGLTLSGKNIPDIEKADLSTRQVAELTFTRPDKADVYVQIQVFFTDIGYNAVILSTDKADYDALCKWATSIQPK